MFLLSKRIIQFHLTSQRIHIDGFEPGNLVEAAYYFRLGSRVEILEPQSSHPTIVDLKHRDDTLVLPPRVPVKVTSMERFRLPPNLLVLIGNRTDLPVNRRIQLLHGMCIDPGYSGYLELLLINQATEATSLRVGERLGKLLFFDISDTGLETAKLEDSVAERGARLDGVYR